MHSQASDKQSRWIKLILLLCCASSLFMYLRHALSCTVRHLLAACLHLQGGKVAMRKDQSGRIGAQAAMAVHSALKQLVTDYCLKAKAPALNLLADTPYRILYRHYTAGRGFARVHQSHKTFTCDHHIGVMCDAYGKGDEESVRTRLAFALSVATVSRGDEIRDITWSQLYWQNSAVIGKWRCCCRRRCCCCWCCSCFNVHICGRLRCAPFAAMAIAANGSS